MMAAMVTSMAHNYQLESNLLVSPYTPIILRYIISYITPPLGSFDYSSYRKLQIQDQDALEPQTIAHGIQGSLERTAILGSV